MRKFLFLFLVITTRLANSQESKMLESKSLYSNILGKETRYSIYLPAGYQTSERNYPVLYLLHGFTDDETAWVQFGNVQNIADASVNSGKATPMIIVMPDAGVTWYINSFDNKVMYEDYFIKELIPHIDSVYHTRPYKEYRAIAGLSMGGYGSLLLSIKHADLFSSAAPLSAGIHTEKEIISLDNKKWNDVYALPFGKDLKGNGRLSKHFQENNILHLIKTKPAEELKNVRYYIDCGDKDFLIKGNMELHSLLIDKDIPHEFRVRKGEHNWAYWRNALPDVLIFVSESFNR